MHSVASNFNFVHPAHSFILDLDDDTWEGHFSENEIQEPKAYKDDSLNQQLPVELYEVLTKLQGLKSFREIYNAFDQIKADPIDEVEKFWMVQSVLNYVLLFVDKDKHEEYEKEQDLLDNVYGFIAKSKRISKTEVVSNRGSPASTDVKNSSRSISSVEKILRQATGDRPDHSFLICQMKLVVWK